MGWVTFWAIFLKHSSCHSAPKSTGEILGVIGHDERNGNVKTGSPVSAAAANWKAVNCYNTYVPLLTAD
jgi:hypothetical protein